MAFHSWITTNNGDTGHWQCELTAGKDSQAHSQTDSLLLFVIFMGHDWEWRAVFEQKQSQYWVYLEPKKKKKKQKCEYRLLLQYQRNREAEKLLDLCRNVINATDSKF